MSEILTFGLMVGQPALRNLCLAGSPRTLLAMSAPRSKQPPTLHVCEAAVVLPSGCGYIDVELISSASRNVKYHYSPRRLRRGETSNAYKIPFWLNVMRVASFKSMFFISSGVTQAISWNSSLNVTSRLALIQSKMR